MACGAGRAGTGAWIGLLLALFFGIFLPDDDVSLLGIVVYWVIAGVVVGAAFGAFTHFMRGGRRYFSSTTSIQPTSFDVQIDGDMPPEAASSLHR